MTWQEKILGSAELPAVIVSGWNSDCPAGWTTAGLIGIDIRHHSPAKQIASSAAFCLLIALQWLVLGGLPFTQPRRWWLEPGACNTAFTVIAVLLLTFGALIASIGIKEALVVVDSIAFPLSLVILVTWPIWLLLLLCRSISTGWKLATQR